MGKIWFDMGKIWDFQTKPVRVFLRRCVLDGQQCIRYSMDNSVGPFLLVGAGYTSREGVWSLQRSIKKKKKQISDNEWAVKMWRSHHVSSFLVFTWCAAPWRYCRACISGAPPLDGLPDMLCRLFMSWKGCGWSQRYRLWMTKNYHRRFLIIILVFWLVGAVCFKCTSMQLSFRLWHIYTYWWWWWCLMMKFDDLVT